MTRSSVGRKKYVLMLSYYWRELAPGLCGRLGSHLKVLCGQYQPQSPSGAWLVATWSIHTIFPKSLFLKKNTTVLLLGKVKHRLGKISDKNSRGLGDEERCTAFKGASWVGPVTCTLNLHDFGQLYIALINIFVKPDQIKMMFVLCMRVLVVARWTKDFVSTERLLDTSGLAE